jgi:hypothetical protein
MTTTKIQVEKHLAEYVIGKFGTDFKQPVRFPANSELYISIYDLSQRRPADAFSDKGNLEIVLPNRGDSPDFEFRKNPEVYNYLSMRSAHIINRKIEVQFWAELHELLDYEKHVNGNEYIESVYYFFRKYRIESITEDCVLKNYYRWREKTRKKSKRAYKKK